MTGELRAKPLTDFAGRAVRSQSRDWCTPPKYVAAVRDVFGGVIELDPCSNSGSVVRAQEEWRLPENDGLARDWGRRKIYVNPPYGADRERGTTIKDWLAKCAATRDKFGADIIALVPVATNTAHWKRYVFAKADAVCFLYDTRLKFLVNGSAENKGAPMACACVYWGGDVPSFIRVFSAFGAAIALPRAKNKMETFSLES